MKSTTLILSSQSRMLRTFAMLLLGVVALDSTFSSHAQNALVTLSNADTVHINACLQRQGILVDDGGFIDNYSDGFSGWAVIEAPAGCTLSLSGHYATEECCDRITVVDASGNELASAGGDGTLDISTTSGRMKVHFQSDWGTNRSGFALMWTLTNLDSPCPQSVTNLMATAIGATSATLSWSGAGGPFHIIVDGVEVDSTTATTYTLTGLTTSSCHHVTVYNQAAIGQPCCADMTSFRTQCGHIEMPYYEDFDDLPEFSFPACWSSLTNFDDADYQPQLIDLSNGFTDNALMLSCGSNTTPTHFGMVMGPVVENDGPWYIDLQLRASHFDTRIILGTCDTSSDAYTSYGFTAIDTFVFDDNNQWYTYQATWSGALSGRRLAIRMEQSMQDGYGLRAYIDKVSIRQCAIAEAYSLHPESDRLTIVWTTLGTPSVDVGIRRANQALVDEQVFTGATSPLTITGLDAATEYVVSLYPTCASRSNSPTAIRARTLNTGFNGDRYCLGICEDNTFPPELTILYADRASVSNGYINIESWNNDAFLVSEPIDNLAGKQVSLIYTGYYPTVVIGTMTHADDTSTFSPLDTIQGDYYQLHYGLCTIPPSSTDRFLALKVRGNCDITGLEASSCVLDSCRVIHHRGTSVSITWASLPTGNSEVAVEYGPKGFSYGTGTLVTTTDPSITIGGLSPLTEYDFVVYRPCGGDACGNIRLRTQTASDDYTIPYCEDFEQVTSDAWYNDWQRHEGFYDCPKLDATYCWTPSNALELVAIDRYGSTILLPDIEYTQDNILSFWALTYAPSSIVEIVEMVDDQWSTPYHAIDTIVLNGQGLWRHYTYAIPDTVRFRLGLHYVQQQPNSLYRLWLDNMQVQRASYEYAYVTNVGPTVATVTTQMLGTADSLLIMLASDSDTLYRIYYNNSDTISGLTPNTLYRCYITPLGEDDACTDYFGYFITPEVYGNGLPLCYTFDDADTSVLPYQWAFDNRVAWGYTATDLGLSLTATLDATHPQATAALPYIIDATGDITFAAKATTSGSYLIVGAPSDITVTTNLDISNFQYLYPPDTLFLDTARWTYYTLHLDSLAEWGNYVTFTAGALTPTSGATAAVMLDNLSTNPCPQLHFEMVNTTLVCTAEEGANIDYLLDYTSIHDTSTYHITTSPFRINGLHMATEYTLTWLCLQNDNPCPMQTTVTTPALLNLPYCNTFDNEGNNIPTEWTFVQHPGDTFYYNPYEMLCIQSDLSHWVYTLLPETPTYNNLSAWITLRTYNPGNIELGVLANPTDTASFITLAQYPLTTGEWYNLTADLHDYRNMRIALRSRGSAFLSNIYLDTISAAHYSLVAARTVDIHTQHASSYTLSINANGDACQLGDTLLHITDTAFRLVDTCYGNVMTPAWYQFSQYSDSAFAYCHPRTTIELSYSHPLPYCHQFPTVSGQQSLPWGWRTHQPSGHPSAYLAQVESHNAIVMEAAHSQYVVLPEPDIDSLRHVSIQLSGKSQTGHDSIIVGVLTDAYDTTTFVALDTIGLTDTWQSHTGHLSAYLGSGRWVGLHTLQRDNGGWIALERIALDGCHNALNATVVLQRHNIVEINSADSIYYGTFYAEYGLHGFTQGEGTSLRIDSLPTHITLDNNTDYDFYFHCDSLATSCLPAQTITTLCPALPFPTCITFDTNRLDTMPYCWFSRNDSIRISDDLAHSGSRSLLIPTSQARALIVSPDIDVDNLGQVAISLWVYTESPNDRLVVGTMTNPYDNATFHPLRTLIPEAAGTWQRFIVDFASAPDNAHFIALRNTSATNDSRIYVDDIYLSDCGAHSLRATNVDDNAITLDWNQVGSPDVRLTIMDGGYISRIITGISTHPYTVNALQPFHRYTFILTASCGDNGTYCHLNYTDTLSIITPTTAEECVNPTDLHSPQATFFSGTYGNPYNREGAIDYGNQRPDSRHTIHYDTSERDPRTNHLLRTVPTGATAAIRLGNWNANNPPEAEGAIYSLFVDTMSFNIILLRYAVVLQNPLHAPSDQPRFRIELLDSTMHPINPECTAADYVASRNLNWQQADNDVIWLDWTSTGIDLTSYANQNIYLRITTFDCNEGSHYGYAYFAMQCMRKEITTDRCGDIDSLTLTAPEGFAYRWHTTTDTTTVSTQQSITVAADGTTYTCELSFTENAECNFSINAYAGTRYPLAAMDTSSYIQGCALHVNFNNTSTLSADGVTPLPQHEPCETAHWDFGNGQSSDDYHATATYYLSGTYEVTLVVGIAGNQCTDTLRSTIVVDIQSGRSYDTIAACDSATWRGNTYTASGEYTDTIDFVNAIGCDSTVTLVLTISHPDTTTFADTIAKYQFPYHYQGHSFDSPVDTLLRFPQPNGCDNITHLTLHATDRLARHICDSQLPFKWHGHTFEHTDSIVVSEPQPTGGTMILTLVVYVHPTYEYTDTIVICPGAPFEFNGVDYGGPTSFTSMQLTRYECDSIIHVTLQPRDTNFRIEALYSFDSTHWYNDNPVLGCAPAVLHLRDTTPGAYHWQWTLTTPDTSLADTLPQLDYHFARGYDDAHSLATLVVTSGRDCRDTLQLPVYIFRSPEVAFEWDPAVPAMHDPRVQFINHSQPDSLAYLWQIQRTEGGSYDTSSATHPRYHWGDVGDDMTGEYNVNLIAYWTHYLDTVVYTCTDTAQRVIVITNDNLLFPNLVTPNGDGKNDTWEIVNLLEYNNYPINELHIYNAWGVLVYHVRNISSHDQFWDPEATSSPDGTYFYRFSAISEYGRVKRNGIIEVIRE